MLVLAAPWFVYMYLRFREDFVNGYFLDENVRLFAASRFANQPRLLVLLPDSRRSACCRGPGSLIGRADRRYPGAGCAASRLDGIEVLLWAWTVAIVGFFTLSTFKLDHYVFPAAPALCLLCARAWSDAAPRAAAVVVMQDRASACGSLVRSSFSVGVGRGYFPVARLDLPPLAMSIPFALTLAGIADGRDPRRAAAIAATSRGW